MHKTLPKTDSRNIKWASLSSRDKDALIARHVMGWKRVDAKAHLEPETFFEHVDGEEILIPRPGNAWILRQFSPTTNSLDCAMVKAEFLTWEVTRTNGEFLARIFWGEFSSRTPRHAYAPTEEEAFCLAALRTVEGVEVEG
jgi:hypothetical protein